MKFEQISSTDEEGRLALTRANDAFARDIVQIGRVYQDQAWYVIETAAGTLSFCSGDGEYPDSWEWEPI